MPDGYAYAPVSVSSAIGTRAMTVARGSMSWSDPRFGAWLVCKFGDPLQLWWFDTISGAGYDTDVCAQVQLVTEYL